MTECTFKHVFKVMKSSSYIFVVLKLTKIRCSLGYFITGKNLAMHCSDWIWNGPSVVIWVSQHIRGETGALKTTFQAEQLSKVSQSTSSPFTLLIYFFPPQNFFPELKPFDFYLFPPHRSLSLLIRSYHFHTSKPQLQLLNPFFARGARVAVTLFPVVFSIPSRFLIVLYLIS